MIVRTKKRLQHFILLPFGIALLSAGLFFNGGYDTLALQASPTQDRLAAPTLPPEPSQADYGAQVYWLSCMPCHGDRGQGLTDEFRQTYPPEDQYCWERGCHGKNPYESGFTLPMIIPAVIGPDAISKFSDAAQLNSYIRMAMPFWKPGSLTEEDSWRVTAFLMRENRFLNSVGELDASNAGEVSIPHGTKTSPVTSQQIPANEKGGKSLPWPAFLCGSVILFLPLFFILKKIQKKTPI